QRGRWCFSGGDCAVESAVREGSKPDNVRKCLTAVRRIVYLESKPRDDGRMPLVADVDDSRHRVRRQVSRASGRGACRAVSGRSSLIDEHHVRLAGDMNIDRVLRHATVFPEQLADQGYLRIGLAQLNLTGVVD